MGEMGTLSTFDVLVLLVCSEEVCLELHRCVFVLKNYLSLHFLPGCRGPCLHFRGIYWQLALLLLRKHPNVGVLNLLGL